MNTDQNAQVVAACDRFGALEAMRLTLAAPKYAADRDAAYAQIDKHQNAILTDITLPTPTKLSAFRARARAALAQDPTRFREPGDAVNTIVASIMIDLAGEEWLDAYIELRERPPT